MPDKEISFDHLKELLLLLCRYPFEKSNKETLSNLLSEVNDWQRMVKLINAHGIIALADYNIREAGLEQSVPADAIAALDNGRMQSMVRNTWLTERWKEVDTILTNAGIKHILLKGMALEHTLYGAKGLRQMTDNDILVKREDSLKAWHLLQEKGFTQGLIKSPLFSRIVENYGKHLPCLYKNDYAIEIHYRLYDNKHDYDKFLCDPFKKTDEIQIGKIKALVLSREIQLAHLIDHFEKHLEGGEAQLRLYSDIVLLDNNFQISFPDDFINDPSQINKIKFLIKAYRATVRSIPVMKRWLFILGDVFPSMEWMKNRYNCNAFKAILLYPPRIGKLLWLI